MLEFVRMVTVWYSQIDRLPTPALKRLFLGGSKLASLFGLGSAASPEPAEPAAPAQSGVEGLGLPEAPASPRPVRGRPASAG